VPSELLRLREEKLAERVKRLEAELKQLRSELAVLRDWLEELEARHAVLELKLYDLRVEVGKG